MKATDRLREAARSLQRSDADDPILGAAANWLLAEAAVQDAWKPFVEVLMGADLQMTDGITAALQAGTQEGDDRIEVRVDSSAHALAFANAVLGDQR